ncbi:MAG: Dot/Icm type IV secretion system effector CoxH3 [Ktedonobacterales bacterium]
MEGAHVRQVIFPSAEQPPVLLEGLLHEPPDLPPQRRCPAAVLCHPQPASADMSDRLTSALATALAAAGVVALRFNFRGVGGSQGQQTDGRLEPLDVAGAVEYVLALPRVDATKLCLLGHAFGAYVALTYAAYDPRVRTVVAVSPPVARLTAGVGAFDRPRFFVTGELDEVSPRYKLEPWIAQLSGSRHLAVVSEATHLMAGHEATATDTIVRYVERWAATPGV